MYSEKTNFREERRQIENMFGVSNNIPDNENLTIISAAEEIEPGGIVIIISYRNPETDITPKKSEDNKVVSGGTTISSIVPAVLKAIMKTEDAIDKKDISLIITDTDLSIEENMNIFIENTKEKFEANILIFVSITSDKNGGIIINSNEPRTLSHLLGSFINDKKYSLDKNTTIVELIVSLKEINENTFILPSSVPVFIYMVLTKITVFYSSLYLLAAKPGEIEAEANNAISVKED